MNMHKLCVTAVLIVLVAIMFSANIAKADTVVTDQDYEFNLGTGDSFAYQDLAHENYITFTITSGALNSGSTGNLTVTTTTGYLLVTPNASGVMTITANASSFYLAFNGLYVNAPYVYSYTSGVPFTVDWQYTSPSVSYPVVVGTVNTQLYFRSDTYSINTETAYGLDTSNTGATSTVSDTAAGALTVTYGVRVWILHYGGSTTELTAGTPTATVSRAVDGSGFLNNTWTPDEVNLLLGYDSLKVIVYLTTDGGANWLPRATFISNHLINSVLYHQTWTFNYWTSKTTGGGNTVAAFKFGSSTYNSGIADVGFKDPTSTELESWRLSSQDYVGFIIGPYGDRIGAGTVYLLLIGALSGSLYLRGKSYGQILFVFILFGGPGGLIWVFVPMWAAAIIDALLILGAVFLVFKVIR
jgi:hypothetical protein